VSRMAQPTGWMLHPEDRAALLERFAPLFPDIVADHVTLDGGAGPDDALPHETAGEIVGITDDGAGVQALVVAIGGTTDRPDGSTYHSTWSIDRAAGRHAIESNDVIRERGWRAVEPAIPIRLMPTRLSADMFPPAP
jgi:hypothetical protein